VAAPDVNDEGVVIYLMAAWKVPPRTEAAEAAANHAKETLSKTPRLARAT
jgi:hypothetical protein